MAAITQQTAKTEFITGPDDVKYAYRRLGQPTPPTCPSSCCHNFVQRLAQTHPIILLDCPGIGHSTKKVASTFAAMATEVINFLSLIKVSQVDLLGFSMAAASLRW